MIGGRRCTGPQLASLVHSCVAALNKLDIPNIASMIEVFNRDLGTKVRRAGNEGGGGGGEGSGVGGARGVRERRGGGCWLQGGRAGSPSAVAGAHTRTHTHT